jgi:hypothetical protein
MNTQPFYVRLDDFKSSGNCARVCIVFTSIPHKKIGLVIMVKFFKKIFQLFFQNIFGRPLGTPSNDPRSTRSAGYSTREHVVGPKGHSK